MPIPQHLLPRIDGGPISEEARAHLARDPEEAKRDADAAARYVSLRTVAPGMAAAFYQSHSAAVNAHTLRERLAQEVAEPVEAPTDDLDELLFRQHRDLRAKAPGMAAEFYKRHSAEIDSATRNRGDK